MSIRYFDRGPPLLPPPLDPEQLRQVACEACGCADPKCPLVLNARCHKGGGVFVRIAEAVLEIVCATCARPVVFIALPVATKAASLEVGCHKGHAVLVKYFKLAHALEIVCAKCSKPVVTISLVDWLGALL
jgi:DNA-directed RNA polymerase subunit RPC12/RpoP